MPGADLSPEGKIPDGGAEEALRGAFVTDPLLDDLRRQIRAGVLKPGEPVMPVRQLSKTYAISYNSVRRALNQLSKEGLLSLERGRGTFVKAPKPLPKSAGLLDALPAPEGPKTQRGGLKALTGRQAIGVLFYAGHGVLFGPPCYRDTIQEIQRLVLGNGDALTLATGHHRKGQPSAEEFLGVGFDGILLLGIVDRKVLSAFAASPLPCVLLDHWPEDIPLNCVVVDNFSGAYLLTKTLLQLGHREICFLRATRSSVTGAPDLFVDPDVAEREAACRLALKEEGLALRESHAFDVPLTGPGAEDVAGRVLALEPRPTAIFAGDQGRAVRLCDQLKARGLQVPADVSVVCFGSKGEADPYEFTSARSDFVKMGESGVVRLRQLMGGAPSSRLRVNIPVEVVNGRTVAPPPASRRGKK